MKKKQKPKNFEEFQRKGHKARKGKPAWNKGMKMSKSFGEQGSKSRKGLIHNGSFKEGHKPWNKGKSGVYSVKTREQMRKSAKKGEESNFWRGGGSGIGILIRACSKYTEWRDKIYFRDKYVCQDCKKKGKKIHAHHLKSLVKIIQQNKIEHYKDFMKCEELWELKNGITLCEKCHKKRHKIVH